MKICAIILTLSVLAVVSVQSCIPKGSPHTWFTVGNVHYTHTKLNVRWNEADQVCKSILPGLSRLAEVRTASEWRGIKSSVTPNWYWFNNRAVVNIENNVRYFHFDERTRLYRQVRRDTKCLVYVYPGSGTTDMYCGMNWARGLCEVRC